MLYIWTIALVLHTPNADWNMYFQVFHVQKIYFLGLHPNARQGFFWGKKHQPVFGGCKPKRHIFVPFLHFSCQKHEKSIFLPAFGVHITNTLAEIHNRHISRFRYWEKAGDFFRIILLRQKFLVGVCESGSKVNLWVQNNELQKKTQIFFEAPPYP